MNVQHGLCKSLPIASLSQISRSTKYFVVFIFCLMAVLLIGIEAVSRRAVANNMPRKHLLFPATGIVGALALPEPGCPRTKKIPQNQTTAPLKSVGFDLILNKGPRRNSRFVQFSVPCSMLIIWIFIAIPDESSKSFADGV